MLPQLFYNHDQGKTEIHKDEDHQNNKVSLQYYLNCFLDDEFHDDFRMYISFEDDFEITEANMFSKVHYYMEYQKEMNFKNRCFS